MDNYQFYIRMDEQEFGPYSLAEMIELPLLEDTLVTESRLNGEWRPAKEFDFEGLSRALEEKQSAISHSPDEVPAFEPSLPVQNSQNTNFTDSHVSSQLPNFLDSWNWGAFSLSWLWGIFHGIYWPILVIACNFIPYVGPIIGLGVCVYLGMNGNKMAWDIFVTKNKGDVFDFTQKQSKWNMAGIVVFVIVIICSLVGAYIYSKRGLL